MKNLCGASVGAPPASPLCCIRPLFIKIAVGVLDAPPSIRFFSALSVFSRLPSSSLRRLKITRRSTVGLGPIYSRRHGGVFTRAKPPRTPSTHGFSVGPVYFYFSSCNAAPGYKHYSMSSKYLCKYFDSDESARYKPRSNPRISYCGVDERPRVRPPSNRPRIFLPIYSSLNRYGCRNSLLTPTRKIMFRFRNL